MAQTSTSFKNWIFICVLILFLQFSFGGDRDFGLMQMCWLSHNPEVRIAIHERNSHPWDQQAKSIHWCQVIHVHSAILRLYSPPKLYSAVVLRIRTWHLCAPWIVFLFQYVSWLFFHFMRYLSPLTHIFPCTQKLKAYRQPIPGLLIPRIPYMDLI